MLRTLMTVAVVAVLAGCSGSPGEIANLNQDEAGSPDTVKKEVTGAVVPTSGRGALVQDEASAPATPIAKKDGVKTAALTNPGTAVDAPGLREKAEIIASVSAPGSASYKIGPMDVIDVSVFKVSELTKSAQVSESGTISFPLVGEVKVAGKTPREVEKEVAQALGGKYLQRPQVAVAVREFNSQRVTLEGAVRRPGVYPVQGGMSLLQAVALGGGFDSAVSDDTVVVFRKSGGKRTAARFDVSEIRDGTSDDPQLQAGDVIVAGTSALKEGFGNFVRVLPIATFATLL